MSQVIYRTTIERLTQIKALEVGQFILISNYITNRVRIKQIVHKAQTIGYKRYPTLNIPIERQFRIFEHQRSLYIARIR